MMSSRSYSGLRTQHSALFLSALLLAALCLAQPIPSTTTFPATTSHAPGDQPISGRITGVRGMVQVKLTETADWQPAKEGLSVDEGAEFRTGPRSAVQVTIDPDQVITLDRLGTVKLLTAVRNAGSGKTKTDIGMKYGRTRYDISAGGVEHESTIRSPNSTLAVKGTMVSLTDTRPFPPEAVSLTGTAQFQAFKRQAVAMGGKSGKVTVSADQGTAAATALSLSVVDPTLPLARQQAELNLVADLISRGAVTSVDRDTGIRIVKGGTVPTDAQIVNLLPDNLNFVLRWSGNANLDLLVANNNETVYPSAGLSLSPSGGKTAFDHQGGPHGGVEIVSWPANFPRQFYGVGVNHVSGPDTPANLQVYLNGQKYPITNFDNTGLPTQSTSVDFTSTPIVAGSNNELFTPGIVDLTTVPLAKGPAAVKPTRQDRPTATPGHK
jgi:hypothetical protein